MSNLEAVDILKSIVDQTKWKGEESNPLRQAIMKGINAIRLLESIYSTLQWERDLKDEQASNPSLKRAAQEKAVSYAQVTTAGSINDILNQGENGDIIKYTSGRLTNAPMAE